ncbi:FHA domain-containing protein [Rhodococcus sp. IEGM 248]|nr:FHA domain-containing protein [Rhodococcus sp. IEGM 248]
MNHRVVHTITVCLHGVDRIFDSGKPVTIARSPDVTLTVDSPWVSRIHAELSWQNGWVFTDKRSTNGVFIDGRRVDAPVRVARQLRLRLGDPASGPLLMLTPRQPTLDCRLRPPQQPAPGVSRTRKAQIEHLPPVRRPPPTAPISAPTGIPPAGLSIGRTRENQIVVDDVLVSRRHARLVPTPHGLTLEDLGSVNGTFVNGSRSQRTALRKGDTVTIGTVDLVVADGTLRYRRARPGRGRIDVAWCRLRGRRRQAPAGRYLAGC